MGDFTIHALSRWAWPIIAIVLGLAVWMSLRHMRQGKTGPAMLREVVRLLAIGFILFTLFQPELVKRLERDEKPEIVILHDRTGSMQTEDVQGGEGEVQSRAAWIQSRLETQFWQQFGEEVKVVVEAIDPIDSGTDLDAPLAQANENYRHLRAVLLISDGDWNTGETPQKAATALRLRGVPVHTVAVGQEEYLPDLALEDVNAPAFCVANEHVAIPFRVVSHMGREIRTRVRLSGDGGPPTEKEVVIPAGGELQDSLIWRPQRLGDFHLELKVPVHEGEVVTTNNSKTFKISVRPELLRVLLVESLPRWEYRYLRNALQRDPGVRVDCLLIHPGMGPATGKGYITRFPADKDAISPYDVVFLGDVGLGDGELQENDLEMIRGLVEQQGSGLVFMPGSRGRQMSLVDSPVGELMPVQMNVTEPQGHRAGLPSPLALTALGEDHLLTMLAHSPSANRMLWHNLPGFYWHAPVEKARPGSHVLGVHGVRRNQYGRVPLLVTRQAGAGNVLFMGTDGAFRWRKGVEDLYHYRFWGQVIRWMAHPRHLAKTEGIRLFYTPENPDQGETVFLQATVLDQQGFPVEMDEVPAQITAPGGRQEDVVLAPLERGWGVFKGQFDSREAGVYQVVIDLPRFGRRLEADIIVSATQRERIGQPARFTVLRDLARITGGEFRGHGQFDQVVQALSLPPDQQDLMQRIPLWNRWWWLLAIVGVLGAYWCLRKLAGLL